MGKKFIYFVSSIAMLALAIAVGFLLSQEVPSSLTSEVPEVLEGTKSIHIEPLKPIESLITHSVEGNPITTSSLADKYAQVQQELILPPDISSMSYSAETSNNSIDSQETLLLESDHRENPSPMKVTPITKDTPENQNSSDHSNQASKPASNPATVKEKAEFDEILAQASAQTQERKDTSSTHDIAKGEATEKSSEQNSSTDENKPTEQKELLEHAQSSTKQSQQSIKNDVNQAEQVNQGNVVASTSSQNSASNTSTNSARSTTSTEPINAYGVQIPKLKANPLVTKSALVARESDNIITNTVLSMDGNQVQFRLLGDAPLRATSFILDNPDRIVFDLSGVWKIKLPRLISNRMVRDFRLGQTDTKTRIVFDMKVKPINTEVLQLSDSEVLLIFK